MGQHAKEKCREWRKSGTMFPVQMVRSTFRNPSASVYLILRFFFWAVQGCKNIFQLYLGSSKSTSEVSSQLIIEVSNKEELKRLLSLLACEAFQA